MESSAMMATHLPWDWLLSPGGKRIAWWQGLALGTASAIIVRIWTQRNSWAPWEAELEMLRILVSDGLARVFAPREEDGTDKLTLRERVQRVDELRAVLRIERNRRIDVAKRKAKGQGCGWGETTGVNHMRHLPGLVFRGEDQAVCAAAVARAVSLPDVKRQAARLRQEAEQTPAMKDLVLVGGGHSHAHVLRMLGMEPQPGVRVTLVTRDVETPYSGMLPGHIAGLYTRRECHIDLNKIARFAGARLVYAAAVGLDLEKQQVLLGPERPPIAYDVLSINIGSAPRVHSKREAADVTPVKPIAGFGARWDSILQNAPNWRGQRRVVVVGGGAGGFELALCIRARLVRELADAGNKAELSVALVTRSGLLPQHSPGARALAEKALRERDVALHVDCEIVSAESSVLRCSDGREMPYDDCIWCTEGAPQSWVGECGLETDAQGFLLVDQQMRCHAKEGGERGGAIFAGGDIATISGHKRPKAGVFAVMGGMALWINLRASLRGERLVTYWPQSSFLGLLNLGDGSCIASRGRLAAEGRWLWELKDWIDRKWMWDYSEGLPDMLPQADASGGAVASAIGPSALAVLQHATMRCGGCGAKVGATTLSKAMARVDAPSQPSPDAGARVVLGVGDDAAVVEQTAEGAGSGCVASVQTIDFFRSFVSDPYVFGRVAAAHALSDCEAMGAVPQTALALAQLPFALEDKTEEELVQLMSGAALALRQAGCALVGGHTCEAKELGLGFAVTGRLPSVGSALRKDALKEGDVLVLTKPLGTGTLFAADMRAKARGPWIVAALQGMLASNAPAASVLRAHGAAACTDVTGFGLVGHLFEMCKGSHVAAAVDLSSVPIYGGALECLAMGITSSLQPSNLHLRRAVVNHDDVCHHAAYPLLYDPQTSGGLLAGVPSASAEACVAALRESGVAPCATVVGEVLPGAQTITVRVPP